jgi:uncharacterized lipoprotein YajG
MKLLSLVGILLITGCAAPGTTIVHSYSVFEYKHEHGNPPKVKMNLHDTISVRTRGSMKIESVTVVWEYPID